MTGQHGRTPYLSPEEMAEKPPEPKKAVGVNSRLWDDLVAVSGYHKGAIFCLLLQIVAIAAWYLVPKEYEKIAFIVSTLTTVISTICVLMIGVKVFPVVVGIFLALVALTPTIGFAYHDFVETLGPAKYLLYPFMGLIALLIVIVKASAVLKKNDVEVGLFGAKSEL